MFDSTKPVRRRDGGYAKILKTDLKNKKYPLAVLVLNCEGEEVVKTYTAKGTLYYYTDTADPSDLVNVYYYDDIADHADLVNVEESCNYRPLAIEGKLLILLFVLIGLFCVVVVAKGSPIEPRLRYEWSSGGVWAEGLTGLRVQRENFLEYETVSPYQYHSPFINWCLDVPDVLEIFNVCGRPLLGETHILGAFLKFPENSTDPVYGESGFMGYLYEPRLSLSDLSEFTGVNSGLFKPVGDEVRTPVEYFVVTVPEPSTMLLAVSLVLVVCGVCVRDFCKVCGMPFIVVERSGSSDYCTVCEPKRCEDEEELL